MDEKIKEPIEFMMPLTYPEEAGVKCKLNNNQDEIRCKVDRTIENKKIIIEQRIILKESNVYFTLTYSESKEELKCLNIIYEESKQKINNKISFRQVSHFTEINNGFSFYLITLINEKLNKGKKINLQIYINKNKVIKNAICNLENDVIPENNIQSQGNFLCKVILDSKDNLEFDQILLLSDNNEINGLLNIDEISRNPYLTDQKIKESKNNVIDYLNEKKEINILTLNDFDINNCNVTGKLILKGSFSQDIIDNINFNLVLTYPNKKLKCTIYKTIKNSRNRL